jgi:hypothetical protein
MSEWISALEASRHIKDAGLTKEDLMEWARLGKLKTRAQSGTFNLDDPPEKRVFPKEPPSDEREFSVRGCWPEIPADYWAKNQVEVLWGAGTCEARVTYWTDDEQVIDVETVKLFGLTFSKVDLDTLLDVGLSTTDGAPPPKERWQQQRVTEQQAGAVKFTCIALTHPLKDPRGSVASHNAYLKWHADPKNRQTDEPFKPTAFKKWKNRCVDGWRVSDRFRWVHNP